MPDTATFLATARRVIGIEARALDALAGNLGDSFAQAATLASTGTPAQYVHPGEASHGDLGMVTADDVALVLSNSGETTELSDIIAYTRRFSIPLIGVAGREGSTLLRQSDVAILLPKAEEACGTGVVPTTSTTMTLALGDALAVALMEHRRFTPEHFRMFHPGGKLGARLSLTRDLMHSGDAVPLIAADTPMSEALLTISQKGFGVVGVTGDGGRLVGIVTDGDLRRHMDGLLALTAAQVMTPDPRTIAPGAMAEAAVALMNERKITCLFVVEPDGDGRPQGILHIHDCLRAGVV